MTDSASFADRALVLNGRGGADVATAEQLRDPRSIEHILWVDLNLQQPDARTWLRTKSGIDAVAVENLLAGETRPRSLQADNGLLVVLRGVNHNPGADPEDMVAVRVWLEPGLIITSRRRRMLSVEDMATALVEAGGPRSAGEFLVRLVERLANRIGDFVAKTEDRTTEIETRIATEEAADLRATLADLRREIAAIRRFLAPQRDALDRLYRQPTGLLSKTEGQQLRDEADRLTRFIEDLDLAREHVLVAHEELQNRIAQEQNQRMYLLSVIAAIFLPLTFVTGLLGMNVAGLPGTESPAGFVVSVVLMAVLGVGLGFFFRWMRWI